MEEKEMERTIQEHDTVHAEGASASMQLSCFSATFRAVLGDGCLRPQTGYPFKARKSKGSRETILDHHK